METTWLHDYDRRYLLLTKLFELLRPLLESKQIGMSCLSQKFQKKLDHIAHSGYCFFGVHFILEVGKIVYVDKYVNVIFLLTLSVIFDY